MKIELLPEHWNAYKVNFHCHTNISDGKFSPEEIKYAYKKMGYSAVCFTDHEVLLTHPDLCDEDFIALHGYEVAIKQNIGEHSGCFMPVYHFNLIPRSKNTKKMPLFFESNPSFPGNAKEWADNCAEFDKVIDATVYDPTWIDEYLKTISEAGFLCVLNHPEWSLQDLHGCLSLQYLHGLEVFNGACILDGHHDGTSIHFDRFLRAGKRLVPTAGDDNHRKEHQGLAWTMVKAPALSYDALIDSYEKGLCYVSEGPEIHGISIVDDTVVVNTSPARKIVLLSEGRYTQHVTCRAETVTEAVFPYSPQKYGSYFRIEVRDTEGNYAYSPAYFIDELEAKTQEDT